MVCAAGRLHSTVCTCAFVTALSACGTAAGVASFAGQGPGGDPPGAGTTSLRWETCSGHCKLRLLVGSQIGRGQLAAYVLAAVASLPKGVRVEDRGSGRVSRKPQLPKRRRPSTTANTHHSPRSTSASHLNEPALSSACRAWPAQHLPQGRAPPCRCRHFKV